MSILSVVVGGQFGSEAKGAVTARLARQSAASNVNVHVVRVAGPNAGHTAYDDRGNKWPLRTVPVGAVVPGATLYIAPGSEIDIRVLHKEVTELEAAGIPVRDRLLIDGQATILTDDHVETEGGADLVGRLGSTGKGIGAARADRIMRKAQIAWDLAPELSRYGLVGDVSTALQRRLLEGDSHVIVEGTQGYGLGLHAGYYPQCTSSDCRAVDFLAMAGIDQNLADSYEVWVVLRRYPIRVAGNSGQLLNETTWEALDLEPEKTTVTQKIRRVGEWDPTLARRAVLANGGPRVVRVALTMADQAIRGIAGADGRILENFEEITPADARELNDLVSQVQNDAGAEVLLVGTGPNSMLEL